LLEVDAGVGEYVDGDAFPMTQQTKQQVLRPHIAVVQVVRFAHRKLKHLFGARRVGQVGV
jgi:hypothetical protein